MNNAIKIILSILLLICLLDMPYGYYEFIRFVSMAVFAYFAFNAFGEEKQTEGIVYILLALLFQPFIKIALGRELWNIVDVVVAIGLIASVFMSSKTNKQEELNEQIIQKWKENKRNELKD